MARIRGATVFRASAVSDGATQPADVEAANLAKWRASGRPQRWVSERSGQWNHDDWLRLLDDLKRSAYWPMKPDAVGATLEALKRE